MNAFRRLFRKPKALVLRYQQLNQDWNADPGAPEEQSTVNGSTLRLEFFLNDINSSSFGKMSGVAERL